MARLTSDGFAVDDDLAEGLATSLRRARAASTQGNLSGPSVSQALSDRTYDIVQRILAGSRPAAEA